LDVGANQLTSLPDWIGNLKRLRHLDVGANQLTSLPDSLANLKTLEVLDLKNPYPRPPPVIEKIKCLYQNKRKFFLTL
ncbi:MAG: hypothetical protein ACOC35_03870, partial [Promethearchaeia archaeon]